MSQEEEKKKPNESRQVVSRITALVGNTWKVKATKERGQKKRYVLWVGVDGGTIRNNQRDNARIATLTLSK